MVTEDWGLAMRISVILCTYNGAERLPVTLEKLAGQILPQECEWEVLLIDNASIDDTASIAAVTAISFPVPLRVLHEATPGKHHALETAFSNATGTYYCIVDDDNSLEPDYLRNGMEFLDQHPDVAMIGGRTFPQFPDGVTPPADFYGRYSHFLACHDHGPERLWSTTPPGAGQMGRVSLMRGIYEHIGTWASCRVGNSVDSGEDLEKALVCRRLGWQTAHVPDLRLHHRLTSRRLTEEYIDALQCAALSAGPWLRSVGGLEDGTSRRKAAFAMFSDILLVGKYALLSIIPAIHPKLKRAPFWRRFYSSRLAGRVALLRKRKQARDYIARIDSAPPTFRPQDHRSKSKQKA